MRLRRENSVSIHKTAEEEYRLRAAIADNELIRNHQIQYGILLEAQQRLPIALQAQSAQRLKELGNSLMVLAMKRPYNYPRGFDPREQTINNVRRRRNSGY